MPSYAAQVTREERWAIVNYIRVLQRAKNAKASDLQTIKRSLLKNVTILKPDIQKRIAC